MQDSRQAMRRARCALGYIEKGNQSAVRRYHYKVVVIARQRQIQHPLPAPTGAGISTTPLSRPVSPTRPGPVSNNPATPCTRYSCLVLQDCEIPPSPRRLGLPQVSLQITPMIIAPIALQSSPAAGRAVGKPGAVGDAVDHARRPDRGQVLGARLARVVDAAEAEEGLVRVGDLVDRVVCGRAGASGGRGRRCCCGGCRR